MMKITVENGIARIFTPYNAEFVSKVKNIGGRKWDSDNRCWMVPETEIEAVRQYMMDVYGETDLPSEDEKITVKVIFNDEAHGDRESVVLFGKTIARAWGRDSGAKIGEDVTLISGSINSGGSVKNWRTVVKAGSVFTIRNLSKAALNLKTDYDVTAEEVKTGGVDRQALVEEKEKLLARLAEIEKLLAE